MGLLQTPALRVPTDDLLGCQGQGGREEVVVPVRALAVADEHPAYRHQPRPAFVPMARGADGADAPLLAAVPAHQRPPQPPARGDHLLGCRQLGPLDARAALAAVGRGRLAQVGRGIVAADEGDVAAVPAAEARQLVGREVAIGEEDELPLGKPMEQGGHHLPDQGGRGAVPAALGPVEVRGAVQDTEHRQGPAAADEGDGDQDGQAAPLVAPLPDGVGVGGAHGVAVAALAVDVLAPMLRHGVVGGDPDGFVGGQQVQVDQEAREKTRW